MFGKKKIPNPEIEKIENLFARDRIIPVVHGHSDSFVHLKAEEFISLAKMSRSAIFRQDEKGYNLSMYFIFGPDGVMYFTEIEQKVKVK